MRKYILVFLFVFVTAVTTGSSAPRQVRVTKTNSLASAKQMAAAAELEAMKNNRRITVTVMDSGANLILVERMDETEISSVETSWEKAHTAVIYKRPTSEFEDALKNGNTAVLSLKNAIPISGGLPIVLDGEVIGGIGVSGSGNPSDLQCAKAGLNAFYGK